MGINLRWAFASIRSGCVDADGSFTAQSTVRSAFVDVHANRSLRLEAVLAEALSLDAFGIVRAIEIALAQNVDVDLFASDLRIRFGCIALRTAAIVAGLRVLAYRTRRTRLLQRRTLVDVRASLVRIAGVVWSAAAHKCARRIRAHRIQSARMLQALVDVHAFRHRIAAKAFRTQTLETALVVPALGVSSARRSHAFVHVVAADGAGVAIESSRTVALVAALEIRAQRAWAA